MIEVCIVGSGAAAVSAALGFARCGIRPCLIDSGISPAPHEPVEGNIYSLRKETDLFPLMIGEEYQALANLDPRHSAVPVKLASPRFRFVTESASELGPVHESGFSLIQSFARGGLANAWGAGLYRYTDRDLDKFPLRVSDLDPYYDNLVREIGISGDNDDLTEYFGREESLQPPLDLSRNAAVIYERYKKRRRRLNRKGIFIGRPRLAVLSREKNGRTPCDYSNMDFWQPDMPYLYTPAMTLQKLIDKGLVEYRSGLLVNSWRRDKESLIVEARALRDGSPAEFACRKLVLAAGAANSGKIALQSRKDTRTQLVLMDNPALQFPFVLPGRIGKALETEAFGLTQLNLIYDQEDSGPLCQGSILEVTSPARSEFFSYFPLAGKDNIQMIKYMLPALFIIQFFLPADPQSGALFSLDSSGRAVIEGRSPAEDRSAIRAILRSFRTLGAFSHRTLVQRVPQGHGIHYAGTLPMRENSTEPYTCSRFGELYGEPNVYVADGALFPFLPAKNFSFTVMANAMRIAGIIAGKNEVS